MIAIIIALVAAIVITVMHRIHKADVRTIKSDALTYIREVAVTSYARGHLAGVECEQRAAQSAVDDVIKSLTV